MATIDINDYALMNDALTTRHLVGTLYGGEYQAHRFLIRAVKDGAEQNLTGAVTARFLRKADDPVSEVVMNGEIIGGKASVTLAQSCYAIPGRFELTIFLTQNGSKTALYNCAGIVRNTSASPVIDPGQIVPDVDDILAQYQMMVDATDGADAAARSATFVSNYTRTLTPGNFQLTYQGYVMQAESAVTPGGDPSKAVKQALAGWDVYTYEFGYNALIRIDKLVKNSNVSGVIPMAIRRWTGRDGNNQDTYAYYALDYDRTAQLFVGDQLMLNHVDPNGFALDYIGVSMITNYNFNDVINCTDHIGQFDSVVVFGDSIFAGYMPWDNTLGESHIGRGVCQQVAETLGLPMTNYAVPGAYLTTQDTTFKPVIQQVVDWTPTANTTPLILIDGGTNDRYNNELTNFGEYSERDVGTIYGSLLSIVEWLFTKGIQPWQIVLTTPIPNAIRAINVGDQITFLEHINTQLAAISFAYHMIGSAMGVNVINGWRGPFSELGDQYPKQILLPDDVHPSEQGAAYYADYICRLIGGKSTKISERLAYSAAQPFVKGNVSEEGRVFLALAQEDFTPYRLGAVLKKNGDTVSEVDNNEWDIYSYKYFMNQNFSVRMDSLTLNPGVANVLDSGDEGYVANFQHMAYQRIYHNVDLDQYQTTNYPIGTSDAGKTVETCAILVNRRRKDGALAIKDVGITVNAKRDFEDVVVCQDHMGEFDSVVVFGDSIFANHLSNAQGQEIDGHLTNSGVMDRFAALLDLPRENHALGGATLSAMQSSPASVWHQVQAWEGPETGTTPLIMINGGTNDMRLYQLCNMGSYSHIDPIEIYGGLCEIIENLEGMGIQPWQIVVNTPIPKGYFADVYNLTLFDAQLTAIGYAMYEVCLKYGVSVINGYRGPFSNVDSTALKQKLMPDSTHPSADGAMLYARHIYRALCSGGSGELREEVADLNNALTSETNARTLLASRVSVNESDIAIIKTHKVNKPLDNYNQPTNGTNGQLLRTLGDGTTEWTDVGLPTEEQTAEAIAAWLDAHPEATTTVEDNSLTYVKLVKGTLGFVTPEMFGAVGDGTTDDTDAIQSVIDYAYAHNMLVLFRSSTVYACTSIQIKHGEQCIDFNGCTLRGLSESKILNFDPLSYNTATPNGYMKNLTIDMNGMASIGLYVNHSYRKIYDSIVINDPPEDGIGLYVDGASACAGNAFNNIRGRSYANSGETPETTFIYIDAADNTFHNCDFVNYTTGINMRKYATISNFHGFIGKEEIYHGSKFMIINSPCVLSNVYPDTQQYCFDIETNDKSIIISNADVVFNTSIISSAIVENYPPYIFKQKTAVSTKHLYISGLSISSPIYTDSTFTTISAGSAIFNIDGFTINGDSLSYNIHRFGTEAYQKHANITFNSALRSGYPVVYPEGYKDTMEFTGNITSATSCAVWSTSRRFTPKAGRYPAIKYTAANGSYALTIVYIDIYQDQRVLHTTESCAIGDKIYIDLPVQDYLIATYTD